MAVREQQIDIGYGVEKVWRVVHDDRNDPAHRMQTGFVQYNNNRIPVWRPYDPTESGWDASWRDGVWRNIHSLIMPDDPAVQTVQYVMAEHDIGEGLKVLLPKVETQLTPALLEHLKEVRGRKRETPDTPH